MASWVPRNELCTLLVIVAFYNVKSHVTYDLDVKNIDRTSVSELDRPTRIGVLEQTREYIRNIAPPPNLEVIQNEKDNGDSRFKKLMTRLMESINKEVRKRGIQSLAKNGDFPKKNEEPRLQTMVVTNYTFPYDYYKQYEY